MSDGGPIGYDTLIVATGARFSYFGHDDWARHATGLKSIDDALEIRRRILIAFEAAEREHDLERREEWMTFVVVGGGPTGVELAGALGEIAKDTLKRDFRSIDPTHARIMLVEAMDRVLPPYPPDRSESAKRQLEKLGVDCPDSERGSSTSTIDRVRLVIGETEEDASRRGRFSGRPASRCRASSRRWPRRPAPSTIGRGESSSGRTLPSPATRRSSSSVMPPSCHGRRIGRSPASPRAESRAGPTSARRSVAGVAGEPTPPFRYTNKGEVAIIGRLAGVTDIPWIGPLGRQCGLHRLALWL